MNEELLLTVVEAAGRLKVSPITIRRMITAGELPVVRIGGPRGRLVRIAADVLAERVRSWSEAVTA